MPASVSCGPPWLCDGPTFNGLLLRTQHVAASFVNTGSAQVRGGVMPSGGQMAVSAGGGMSVNVATGYALCPSSSGSTFGGYLFGLMSVANLTVATADPTNPRVDLVCAYANDLGTSASLSYVEILTGTPTAGATLVNLNGAPSAPSNSVVLGYVLVPAGSSSVTSGNISNVAAQTAAQGGIVPVAAGSAPVGYTGMYIHDPITGRLLHNPAAGPAQPKLLPFAPQSARKTSNVTATTSPVTILSVTVTTDGNTDLEIVVHWPAVYPSPNGGNAVNMAVQIDGTQVATSASVPVLESASAGVPAGGGGYTHFTTSGVDRPAAGSHTVSFVITVTQAGGGTNTLTVPCSAAAPATLYVRSTPL